MAKAVVQETEPTEDDALVQAVIDEAVAKQLAVQVADMEARMEARFLEKLTAMSSEDALAPELSSGENVLSILSALAMKIGDVAAQGTGRQKPLSPEEMSKRERAGERLIKMIMACRQLPVSERPTYRVTSKVYLNERLIEPFRQDPVTKRGISQEITWTGIPSDAMDPLNETAREIYTAWLEHVGGRPALVPTADNRPYMITANGLTVKGDSEKRRAHVASDDRVFEDDLGFGNNDPNAPQIAVLGTVAQKARNNIVQGKN